jgi:hypothetical protein
MERLGVLVRFGYKSLDYGTELIFAGKAAAS